MNQEQLEKKRERNRKARLLKRGGCTTDRKEAIILEQEGKCAICERVGLTLFIDHCHVTNTVRSALCQNCNIALGHAKDDPERLRKMADYIESHRDWRWDHFQVWGDCDPE